MMVTARWPQVGDFRLVGPEVDDWESKNITLLLHYQQPEVGPWADHSS